MGVVAGLRVPLCQATEAVALGDGAGGLKHVSHAEAVVADAIEIVEYLQDPDFARTLGETERMEAATAFDIYAACYTGAVPIYATITGQGIDLEAARGFFERHETRFAALTQPTHPLAGMMTEVYPVLPALARFTASQRLLVEARIAARAAHAEADVDARPALYDAALATLERAPRSAPPPRRWPGSTRSPRACARPR
jgi:hypothetical protein